MTKLVLNGKMNDKECIERCRCDRVVSDYMTGKPFTEKTLLDGLDFFSNDSNAMNYLEYLFEGVCRPEPIDNGRCVYNLSAQNELGTQYTRESVTHNCKVEC